jgi:hypothetical protein
LDANAAGQTVSPEDRASQSGGSRSTAGALGSHLSGIRASGVDHEAKMLVLADNAERRLRINLKVRHPAAKARVIKGLHTDELLLGLLCAGASQGKQHLGLTLTEVDLHAEPACELPEQPGRGNNSADKLRRRRRKQTDRQVIHKSRRQQRLDGG